MFSSACATAGSASRLRDGPFVSVDASVELELGALHLELELTVQPGELVAILGPNGAGKSTLLRILAGLQPLKGGRLCVDGVTFDEPSNDVFVPPEHRPIGVIFQDYLLFPTMSALENVAFGPRSRGVPKREARRVAQAWLARVGLGEVASRSPQQLSGGQQQRVALARALAGNPRLLLLDEPLAALDVATRNQLRRELRRHLGGFPGMRLLVTHDPVDAHVLADRVIVLENGRVTQAGTLASVTAHPRSRYVADLVGVNLLSGQFDASALQLPSDFRLVVSAATAASGPALAAIRPQAVALHLEEPHGSPRNCWPATVAEVDLHTDRVRVRLDGPVPLTAEITPASLSALGLQPGDHVWATVKATEIVTYPN